MLINMKTRFLEVFGVFYLIGHNITAYILGIILCFFIILYYITIVLPILFYILFNVRWDFVFDDLYIIGVEMDIAKIISITIILMYITAIMITL